MAISFEGGSWKLWTAVAVLLMITLWAPTRGQAFVLSLPGPLGNGSDAVTDQATVLYARAAAHFIVSPRLVLRAMDFRNCSTSGSVRSRRWIRDFRGHGG
jgi:hypothetical protein